MGASSENLLANEEIIARIDLKNHVLAGLLAWIFPGAGHFYQRRFFKAFLFLFCVGTIFFVGCFLGSSREVGVARVVYFSWRESDKRFYFIPQGCLGIAAIPALAQAFLSDGNNSPLGRFMAPPRIKLNGAPPTLEEIITRLHIWYDLGTLFTTVAGLMNLLVIFDALAGPALATAAVSEKLKTGK